MHVIAVDWSGDAQTARNHIWLAEASPPGQLLRLESGRDRGALVDHLLSLPSDDLVIGFDFAFSFPEWFLTELGLSSAPALWSHVALHGEGWLAACEPPFWGRPGHRRPLDSRPSLRTTDVTVPRTAGIAPKSVFQIGGAGAVGTGSIRGMPLLAQLHRQGARIWPFTERGGPVVVEIYPRLFTGPVHKSNAMARASLLATRYPWLPDSLRALATASEDAFDAAISAVEMARHVDSLRNLPTEQNPIMKLEGRIWHPRWQYDGA